MRFEDDGGSPSWRDRHPPTIYVQGRRSLRNITFIEVIALILFFAFFLPFLLVFGVPVVGALVTALLN